MLRAQRLWSLTQQQKRLTYVKMHLDIRLREWLNVSMDTWIIPKSARSTKSDIYMVNEWKKFPSHAVLKITVISSAAIVVILIVGLLYHIWTRGLLKEMAVYFIISPVTSSVFLPVMFNVLCFKCSFLHQYLKETLYFLTNFFLLWCQKAESDLADSTSI